MEPFHLMIAIILATLFNASTYEISKTNNEELIYINNIQDIDIFCRHHTLRYEVELKGSNEIKNKITTSIELLTQICYSV